MEKFLLIERIGEFFSKMLEANYGKRIDVSLDLEKARVQIYYKDLGTFDYIHLVDASLTTDELVETLSK